MGKKITEVLEYIGIEPSEVMLAGIALAMFCSSLIMLLFHMFLSRRELGDSLKKIWGIGILVSCWEKLRWVSKQWLGKIIQFPLPMLGRRRKVVTQSAIESSIIIILFYCFIYIYLDIIFQIQGVLYEFLELETVKASDLLKAIGSLALAFEAVLGGTMQFHRSNNPPSGSSLERTILEQKSKQYTLRFWGALTLAAGYGFIIIQKISGEISSVLNFPIDSVWIVVIFSILVIGFEESFKSISIATTGFLILLSFPMFWYINPLLLVLAIVIFLLFYFISKKLYNYSGIFSAILNGD